VRLLNKKVFGDLLTNNL